MQVEVGAVLEGRVTKITPYGAFVSLPEGKSGLVHISEVANTYVRDVHDHLAEQQEIRVKVIGISPEGKISLSAKQALPPPPVRQQPARRPPVRAAASAPARQEGYVTETSGDQLFEDKLKRFMKESDGKMSGDRRFQQQRRGQRRRK